MDCTAQHGGFKSANFKRTMVSTIAIMLIAPAAVAQQAGKIGSSTPSLSAIKTNRSTSPDDLAKLPDAITVSLEPDPFYGAPTVYASVNASSRSRFLFDTGSNRSILLASFAAKLKVQQRRIPIPADNRYAAQKTMGVIDRVSFMIGGVNPLRTSTWVLYSIFNSIAEDSALSGLIGYTAFSENNASVLLDFQCNKMEIIRHGNLKDVELAHLGFEHGNRSGIPLVVMGREGEEQFYALVEIVGVNGAKIFTRCILDTGSYETVLNVDPKIIRESRNGSPGEYPLVDGGDRQVYQVELVRVSSTANDKANGLRIPVAFEAKPALQSSSLLGMDYLSHFRVLIDYPARMLYLEPIAAPIGTVYPSTFSRANARRPCMDLTLMPIAAGQWQVSAIDSTAGLYYHFGVRQGDILLRVNGMLISGMAPDEMMSYLLSHQDLDRVDLLRQGKPISLVFHPCDE